jgi:membrane associated rhomboid family serine protease
MNGYQIGVPYMTRTVKQLIIVNVAVWLVGVIILQKMVLDAPVLFRWFGLTPLSVIQDFFIWQPFTYMFLHSYGAFHVLFNMLFLWFMGSELESTWGRRFFLMYYLICGFGAGVLYVAAVTLYYLVSSDYAPLTFPVVGASGAIFGLLLAYGIIFGHRIVYFFGIFPMQARYFVMILGGFEVMMLMSEGLGSGVSNLSHVLGILVGYLTLKFYPKLRDYWLRRQTKAHGRRLKLVVDNERPKKTPRYWN